MDEESRQQVASSEGRAKRKARRVGRRTALKTGAAIVAGLALSEAYVKPSVVSAFVEEDYTFSVTLPGTTSPGIRARRAKPSADTITTTRTAPAPATDSAPKSDSAPTTKPAQ